MGIQCPDSSQWKLRTKGICNTVEPWYYCLFDENSLKYKEFCRNKQDFHKPGYKYVVSGNINGKPCNVVRFQPFKFKTDGNSRCVFQKSLCTEEGQVDFNNGTTVSDSTCRCDFTRGYAFVSTPKDLCFCVPSNEDCSCFKKPCRENEILTPDYECVETDHLIGGFACPVIRKQRLPDISLKTENDITKVVHRGTIRIPERKNIVFCIPYL
ncbi:uncharacterized protein LOC127716270 isoform X2 [Mytilus californianus]|nr:uncharacterized protein LOC127716270 isoform X2 [Mytilus californianus]